MIDGLQLISASRDGEIYGGFGDYVEGYRHEWRMGPYQANWRFTVTDDNDLTPDMLRSWFLSRFMSQVRTRYNNAEVWRGYIGKMSLHLDSLITVKDIRGLSNAVKCEFRYKDDDGLNQSAYTNWAINEASIARLGEYNKAIRYNGRADGVTELNENGERVPVRGDNGEVITEPDDRAAQYVKRHATPIMNQLLPGNPDDAYLEIIAYGPEQLADRILLSDGNFARHIPDDVYTHNYDDYLSRTDADALRHVSTLSASHKAALARPEAREWRHGDVITVSQEIQRIVDVVNYSAELWGGLPLLYTIQIDKNERETVAGVDTPTGAMTRLRELAELTDLDGNYYRLTIEPDGGVRYLQLDLEPKYYFFPASGLRNADGSIPTWDMRPDVIKVNTIYGEYFPDTWLGDGSLILPERVTMREGAEMPEITATDSGVLETMWSAIAANQARVKRNKKK